MRHCLIAQNKKEMKKATGRQIDVFMRCLNLSNGEGITQLRGWFRRYAGARLSNFAKSDVDPEFFNHEILLLSGCIDAYNNASKKSHNKSGELIAEAEKKAEEIKELCKKEMLKMKSGEIKNIEITVKMK